MATSPLFGWQEPDDTSLVKDGAAAIRTLGNAIDSSMGDLLGGTTGQVLAKASNTNMDFTWVAQDDSNAIQNAIVDAKGDLIAASANDTIARLAVGANDLVLTAASGEATGLKYTGAWSNWTPTVGNFVKGNGTEVARYVQIGKVVYVFYYFALGSTSSVSGRMEISMPVTPSQSWTTFPVRISDTGTAVYFGMGHLAGATAYIELQSTSGNFSVYAFPSATAPMTWTTSDYFAFSTFYEVA
jgi:hypothetical protein